MSIDHSPPFTAKLWFVHQERPIPHVGRGVTIVHNLTTTCFIRHMHEGSATQSLIKLTSKMDMQILTGQKCQQGTSRTLKIYTWISLESYWPLMLDATEDMFIIFPDFCLSICKKNTYVIQTQTTSSSAGPAEQPIATSRTNSPTDTQLICQIKWHEHVRGMNMHSSFWSVDWSSKAKSEIHTKFS